MQDENGAEVVDELEQEELPEGEQETGQETEGEAEQQPEGEDEVVITLGDEPPPADEFDGLEPTPAIRQLREAYKEKSKRLRELEKQVAAQQQAKPEPALVLPTKPTLEACDYDADKFESELEAWHEKKRAVDEAKRKADEQAEAARREWQAKLDAYAKAKAAAQRGVSKGVDNKGDAYLIIAEAESEFGLDNRAAMIAALKEAAKDPETQAEANKRLKQAGAK
jgi:DNA-binding protein H-NS